MSRLKLRKLLPWAGAAGVLVILVWAFLPRPVEVEIAVVHRGPMQVTVDDEGETRVRERYRITAPVAGYLRRIELEPGDAVRAGETVLVELEPAVSELMDERALAAGQADLRRVRAALARTREERDRAREEEELAVREAARVERLAERGIVSAERREQAATAAATARLTRAAAEQAAREAAFAVEVAEARVHQPAADAGGERVVVLRSPVDGVVLQRFQESAGPVTLAQPLLEVGDTSQLEIVADFLSSDTVTMRPRMPARIEAWGGDEALTARVRRIEPSGFLRVSALGVEEQRVNVILDLDTGEAAARALGDGYRVEVQVVVWEGEDVLQVPLGAVFRRGDGGWAAFAVIDGEARLTAVDLGHRNDLQGEVLSGLAAGDRVVLHPPDAVADGSDIEAREDPVPERGEP